ncbi:autotransporter domain-containing protein [Salmonella enterica]|nr:autotransporter domain-containing protein [Salmonella enterica]ELF7042458.1 autotransporter domain-containing protein [Salmonella enterica]
MNTSELSDFIKAIPFGLILLTFHIQAKTPEEFVTQEYLNNTGLWVTNAAEAYSKGYTGKGVTLGVLDNGVNFQHAEFKGKKILWFPDEGYIYDWDINSHGSHVAGIMAANRDGQDHPGNMHGVAFNANLLAIGTLLDGVHENNLGILIRAVLERPDIKIVNNSWTNSLYYLDELFTAANDAEYGEIILNIRDDISVYESLPFLYTLAEYDKLMVFAAGNDGHRGPSIPAAFPAFLPDLHNWLSVVALDSTDGRISLESDEKTRRLSDSAVPTYSDLAMGAEEFSLAAPGTWINSVNATGGYVAFTGTSMAAPYVSGALGLVQQAYPWMSARQLADTVLSTADRNFITPGQIISLSEDSTVDPDTGNSLIDTVIRLQIVDSADKYWERIQEEKVIPLAGTPERERLETYLRKYYRENTEMVYGYYGIKNDDEFIAAFFATKDSPYKMTLADGTVSSTFYGSVWSVPFDQIFGQGIVNAGKAVDGPSQFNVNRMTPDDFSSEQISVYTGKKELLYAVDTRGFVSGWHNDISQELWHTERHNNILPEFMDKYPDFLEIMEKQTTAGLLKKNEGTLYLTGTNSYQGSTVIEGGILSISQKEDHSGGQLLNSNVYVLPEGQLQGNGTLHQSVSNWGKVTPGNGIGVLSVGSYVQYSPGTLLMDFDSAGHTDRLIVSGDAKIDGTLALSPVRGYYNNPVTFSFNDLISAGSFSSLPAVTELSRFSPTLTMNIVLDQDRYTVNTSRYKEAYSQYASDDNASRVGRALSSAANVQADMYELYSALDFSDAEGSIVRKALTQLSPDAYGNAVLAAFDMQRMLSDTLLSGLFARSEQKDSEWHVFVQPYAVKSDMNMPGGTSGYHATNAGLIVGAEQSRSDGLTFGGHMAMNHLSANGNENGALRNNGFYLGVQGDFSPSGWGGWNLFGTGRIGIENQDMTRRVSFSDYSAENKSAWTSYSGGVRIGVGYEFQQEAFSAGPFSALDYAFSFRPCLTEKEGEGSRLHLDSENFHSLRSVLGVRLQTSEQYLSEHVNWSVQAYTAWNHELLENAGVMHASFAAADNDNFSSTVKMPDRDSFSVGTGIVFRTDKNVSVSLNSGGEIYRRNGTSVYGNLSVKWVF